MRLTFLLVCIITVTAQTGFATRQIADKVIVGEETFGWRGSDLSPVAKSKGIEFQWPNTACHRGYVATWEIKERKLILTELEAWTTDPKSEDITELPVSALFSNGLPIHATWYSGDMHLLRDAQIVAGGKVGGHLVECRYVTYSFSEGELTKTEEKTEYFNIDFHEHSISFAKLFRFTPDPSDFERIPNKDAEQGGTELPATVPDPKPEGSQKPKPESEGRPQ